MEGSSYGIHLKTLPLMRLRPRCPDQGAYPGRDPWPLACAPASGYGHTLPISQPRPPPCRPSPPRRVTLLPSGVTGQVGTPDDDQPRLGARYRHVEALGC